MGSYCVIFGPLGVITLIGVTVAGTLSGGTVTETLVDEIVGTSLCNTVIYFFSGCMV